jgi:hypothetical protein
MLIDGLLQLWEEIVIAASGRQAGHNGLYNDEGLKQITKGGSTRKEVQRRHSTEVATAERVHHWAAARTGSHPYQAMLL